MRHSKKLAALAIAAGVAITATAALAYWTTGGSGSGSADGGDVVAVEVNQLSVAADLYPGVPEALSGDFDNDNAGNVYIARVTAAVVDFVTDEGNGKPECADEDFRINGTSNVPGQIPPGNGMGTWSGLSVELINTGANQDNCKNVKIAITYTAHAALLP
jgi:hypothetical protein